MEKDLIDRRLGEGSERTLIFKTASDAELFVERQLKAWDWFTSAQRRSGDPLTVARDFVQARLNTIRKRANGWKNDPQQMDNFRTAASAIFFDEGFPIAGEAFANFVDQLRTEQGAEVAGAALAAYISKLQLGQDTPFAIVRGAAAAADFVNNNSRSDISPYAIQLDRYSGDFAEQLSKAREGLAQLNEQYEQTIKQAHVRLERIAVDQSNNWNDKIAESISSITNTEAAYREQMKLRASVSYWTDAHTEHEQKAGKLRTFLICYSTLSTLILLVVLYCLATSATNQASIAVAASPTIVYLKFAAIGAVLTTIIFWIGRVVLRMYLSELHLSTDAKERTYMVQTYLALTSEGVVEQTERSLVLQSLFRSAADGIVKDDTVAEASIAAILAKALDRRN